MKTSVLENVSPNTIKQLEKILNAYHYYVDSELCNNSDEIARFPDFAVMHFDFYNRRMADAWYRSVTR